jgi:hypothetical protein
MAKRYPSPTAMQFDPSKSYEAIVRTEKGRFTVQLFAKEASITVKNCVLCPSAR